MGEPCSRFFGTFPDLRCIVGGYIVLLRVRCVRGDVYTREIFKLLMDLYEMCSVWPEEMYLIYVLYT